MAITQATQRPLLCIGVIDFGHEKHTLVNLFASIISASLKDSRLQNGGLILAAKDNAGHSKMLDAWSSVESMGCPLEILGGTQNIGFGAAHNLMMSNAFGTGCEYYLCLNPDGILHPFLLKEILSFSEQLSKPALIEAMQFPQEHPKPYDPFTGSTPWCSGACILIHRDVYRRLNGFDENFFMYCEDVDLSWRAKHEGIECFIASKALFLHHVQEKKSIEIQKLMYLSARYLGYKWSHNEFQSAVEDQLIQSGYYQDKTYLPRFPNIRKLTSDPLIAEWRQWMSFSTPRW